MKVNNKVKGVLAFIVACIVPGGFIIAGVALIIKYFKSRKPRD